jgi:NAD(P)H-hydrate epimerase
VLVDALLGTGFAGQVRPPLDTIIEAINAVRPSPPGGRPVVVAIDLPSGLDADTGRPADATVRADLTITMVARKVGFDAASAACYTGRVIVVDIGAPAGLIEQVQREGAGPP